MTILKEGTISITADGKILVEGFSIKDGNLEDLRQFTIARVSQALANA